MVDSAHAREMIGAGLDLFDIARLERASARRAFDPAPAILTPSEHAACAASPRPARQAALRFAIKEACLKALGTGLVGRMSWHDIELEERPCGGWEARLRGETALAAAALGVSRLLVAGAATRDRVVGWAIADTVAPRP